MAQRGARSEIGWISLSIYILLFIRNKVKDRVKEGTTLTEGDCREVGHPWTDVPTDDSFHQTGRRSVRSQEVRGKILQSSYRIISSSFTHRKWVNLERYPSLLIYTLYRCVYPIFSVVKPLHDSVTKTQGLKESYRS